MITECFDAFVGFVIAVYLAVWLRSRGTSLSKSTVSLISIMDGAVRMMICTVGQSTYLL